MTQEATHPTAPAGGEAPVAWYDPANKDPGQSVTFDKDKAANWPHLYRVPLYTHPSADLRGALEALDHIARRLQMDIDDGSRPDQWSMEDLVRKARAAIASLEVAISRKGKTEHQPDSVNAFAHAQPKGGA